MSAIIRPVLICLILIVTLVDKSNSYQCSSLSSANTKANWNNFWIKSSTSAKMALFEAALNDLQDRLPAVAQSFIGGNQQPMVETSIEDDDAISEAWVMRILGEVDILVNLPRDEFVYHVPHLVAWNEDLAGQKSLYLPELIRSLVNVLPQLTSGVHYDHWQSCIGAMEGHIQDSLRAYLGGADTSKAACHLRPETGDPNKAVRGVVFLKQNPDQGPTTVTVRLRGFDATDPITKHGFHIHTHGKLGNGCKDAGGHYNPYGLDHGGSTDAMRHVADLGNVVEGRTGTVSTTIIDHQVSLTGEHGVLGRSIVVHAGQDDLGQGGHGDSKTTGHAGGRLGCCIIEPFQLPGTTQQDAC